MVPDLRHRPLSIPLPDLIEIVAVVAISVLLLAVTMAAMIYTLGEKVSPPGYQHERGLIHGRAVFGRAALWADPEEDPRHPRRP